MTNVKMQKADLRIVINYSLDVLQNPSNFKNTKFSSPEVLNLLKDLDIVIE